MKALFCALSAKYVHKTLAPWCLKAACDARGGWDVRVLEASVNDELSRIAGEIFLLTPQVVGFSCYIWNLDETQRLGAMVKKLLPNCIILYGGPEVSYGGEYPAADYIICGPGEERVVRLLEALESGRTPARRVLPSAGDAFPHLPTPYTDEYFSSFEPGGLKSRLVYYESSRGCPFSCTYCLSSAIEGVLLKPLDTVFAELSRLMAHGAGTIKFVDRTFNANRPRAKEILRWIAAQDTGCTFHFEAAADLFDEEMLALIAAMPKGRVQLELGIQSIHPPTLEAIRRPADTAPCLDTIRRLAAAGNCHVHVDLIAGLPHETVETFAAGFDACIAAAPHMLQLGFLKALRGTALRAECDKWGIRHHDAPPYEVVGTATMSTHDLLRLKAVEEVLDRFYNSGKYPASLAYALTLFPSPFGCFSALADFCRGKSLRVSLKKSYTLLLDFLTRYGEADRAGRCIRLDCLTFDSKGQLPDALPPCRDKELEREYRLGGRRHIRAERFPGGQLFVFDYGDLDPLSGACRVEALP